LNLTRLHLGIAHESQFQGLGIRLTSASGLTCGVRWFSPPFDLVQAAQDQGEPVGFQVDYERC